MVYPKFAQSAHSPNSPLHTEILMNSLCVGYNSTKTQRRKKQVVLKRLARVGVTKRKV